MTLHSLWEDRSPSDHLERTSTVEGHHEVVIVGGGITGVTLALLLASAGTDVALLEARRLGSGTTGRSTAKVSCLQGVRLGEIAAQHSADVVAAYTAANLEGLAWLRRFCEDQGVSIESRTAWTYATTDSGAERVEREHRVATAAGLATRRQDDLGLPFATTAAVGLDDQFQVDPLGVLDVLAAEAERRGARLHEGVRVRGASSRSGRSPVRLRTDQGEVSATTVVLATNLPILDRGGWFARMTPQRSYALAYTADDDLMVPGMCLSADATTRSLRDAVVDGRRQLLVGGEGHPTGRSVPTSQRLDTLRAWTARHFPEAQETHAWSAQDFHTAHELPVVGPLLPGSDHLLVAGGFAKWGMTNGVAAALALSTRLLGGRADWTQAMESWSARELRGLTTVAAANASVGLEMTRGWIGAAIRRVGQPALGEGLVRSEGLGRPTAIARVDGVEHRVSGVCTHLGGVVRWNDAERSWDCPLHGSRFDVDGEVLEGPATCGLRRS